MDLLGEYYAKTSAVLYNSFVIFSLIDDVKEIKYSFPEENYICRKSDFISDVDIWNEKIRNKIRDITFVNSLVNKG